MRISKYSSLSDRMVSAELSLDAIGIWSDSIRPNWVFHFTHDGSSEKTIGEYAYGLSLGPGPTGPRPTARVPIDLHI
jgi:hypothetical protein